MSATSRLSQAWRYVRRSAVGAASLLGALVVVNAGSSAYQRYWNYKEYLTLPDEFILEIDLERQQLVEVLSGSPVQALLAGGVTRELELRRVLQVLDAAKRDERVRGVVALLGGRDNFQGLAQMQELRHGVMDFRAHAKARGAPIVAYSNAFGEGGTNGTGAYMLASGFDAVYMPPCGVLSLLGMEASTVFVKQLLERLKVHTYVWAREEYKSAAAPLTQERYEGPHKDNVVSLVEDTAQQVLVSIAAARKLTPDQLADAMVNAPLQPDAALQLQLVDGIKYRDEVDALMLARLKRADLWLHAARIDGDTVAQLQPAKQAAAITAQALVPSHDQMPRASASLNPEAHLDSPTATKASAGANATSSISLSSPGSSTTTASGIGSAIAAALDPSANNPSTSSHTSALSQLEPPSSHKAQPNADDRVLSEARSLRRRHKGPRVSLQRYWDCHQHQQQLQQRKQAWARWRGWDSSKEGESGPAAITTTSPELGALATSTADASSPWGAPADSAQPLVVVVHAGGPIVQRAVPGQGLGRQQGVVEAHVLVRALRAMRENKQVAAVVVRINSPGGSAVASDVIARELALLRAAGKPVIASMGDVAASGGYYIAAPANRILAQASTITGSIGVIALKPYVTPLLQDYGLNPDLITFGPNAAWASPFTEPTQEQQLLIEAGIDAYYSRFLQVVAAGRSMTVEAVRAVARGRVWSGKQALDVGLVDEIGGLNRAIAIAKEEAGLSPAPGASLVVEWPPRKIPAFMQALKQLGALPTEGEDALQASIQLPQGLPFAAWALANGGPGAQLLGSLLDGARGAQGSAAIAQLLGQALAGNGGHVAALQALQQTQGPHAVSLEADMLSKCC